MGSIATKCAPVWHSLFSSLSLSLFFGLCQCLDNGGTFLSLLTFAALALEGMIQAFRIYPSHLHIPSSLFFPSFTFLSLLFFPSLSPSHLHFARGKRLIWDRRHSLALWPTSALSSLSLIRFPLFFPLSICLSLSLALCFCSCKAAIALHISSSSLIANKRDQCFIR